MPRVTHVEHARKEQKCDNGEIVKVGEPYYWWKFRYGSKHVSKTQPRPSQLTQSEFLGTIYDLQDRIEEISSDDIREGTAESIIDDVISQLEDLKSETEDKLSNMPEQLQDSDTGQLLQGRCDSIDEWIGDLENVKSEIPEDAEAEEESEIEDALTEINNCQYNGE